VDIHKLFCYNQADLHPFYQGKPVRIRYGDATVNGDCESHQDLIGKFKATVKTIMGRLDSRDDPSVRRPVK
jgi:hypothetical protein